VTAENRKLNAEQELERAREALASADLLSEHGHLSDAISRLYYCALHNIRAVLLTEGLEPRSHEGALRLFSLHFVKSGLFPTDNAHLFSRLMKYREEADYNPSYVFAGQDYSALRQEVDMLIGRIQEHLKARGYL
jgi:uncharacterized protein (UPF0332 family)